MGRLEETSKTLQQHVEALQAQPTLAQQDQEKLAALQQTLQQMTGELDTLRYTHTRMQRDLHNKKLIVMRAVEESELLYKQRLSLQHSAASWTQIFIYGESRRIMQYIVVRSPRC